jgi:hypothetical protein
VAGDWRSAGRIEHGSWERVLASRNVAVIAHYSEHEDTGRSLRALLGALHRAGFTTVLVSTSPAAGALRFGSDPPALVVRRPNIAYDFGSWAWAIAAQPELRSRRVLLLNDSLAGPFDQVQADALLQRCLGSPAEVWGLIGSAQFAWHIQSYCISYAPGVLGAAPVRRFWSSVQPQATKMDVILSYELGQSRVLYRAGFTLDVVVPPGLLLPPDQNPAILAWRRLLQVGIPYVKKELIRDPSVAPDAADVPAELAARYGVDVEEWL